MVLWHWCIVDPVWIGIKYMRRSDYIGGQSAAIKHLPHPITRPSCHPTSATTTISSPSLPSPPPPSSWFSLFAWTTFCCRGWLTTSSPPSQTCGHLVSSWQTVLLEPAPFLSQKVKDSTLSPVQHPPPHTHDHLKVFCCGRSPPMGCLPIRGLNWPKSMRWEEME